jgi:DNA-binding transcriptional LysR family regulator
MFDWNDLRYFLSVARHGSTIAAAKALRLSQSTVHRRLAELEKRMGRHVVIRHATGYRLTEFGKELQPFAEQVEEAVAAWV